MFNTLNSIAQMAYLEEAPSTEQMIEAVSDYFRYNLKDIHHVATVADEVKNCRDYIYIQQSGLTCSMMKQRQKEGFPLLHFSLL